ncbi:MAG: hypothetical protein KBD76_16375 [Bacteriovorax sp.]|nr:hypothetical protein [Bacteriovorax sp.]
MSNENSVESIPNLCRVENVDKNEMGGIMADITHTVYPHDQVYGEYCPVHSYINCPPEKVFDYMSHPYSLQEWTYSMREFKKANNQGLFVGRDKIGDTTDIYFKVVSNKDAMVVDYHCAWDQGEHLWMIYLNRIVPAELVLNKPGSVVFWQNCRHPFYLNNPFPEKAPAKRPWVGEFWDFFYAGHTVELENLKKILEYRHANNLPMGPIYNEENV